jgi:adenylate cyclase
VRRRVFEIWKAASDVLLGKPELRGSEVQSLAGSGSEDAERFWQALGFPPVPSGERPFTRRDVEALRFAESLLTEGDLDPDSLLQMTRTTGQALSRVAHMHVLSICSEIEAAARDESDSDAGAASRVADSTEKLLRSHEPFLGYIWRRHLLAAITQVAASAVEDSGNESLVVGFADLADYTATSQHLSERELIELVERFERIAYSDITSRGGRVIKTLGDEVMWSNHSAVAAAETALAIAESCKADPVLTDVRVGLAIGAMLAWEGDLYGPTVNLAHRLTAQARPGTVLVSDDLAKRLGVDPSLALVEIRDVKLKGIGRTKPWVLRRAEEPPPRRR